MEMMRLGGSSAGSENVREKRVGGSEGLRDL